MPPHVRQEALRFVGDYELLEKIADGGMGSVYRGRSRATSEVVAVKVLAPREGPSQEVLLKRFEQEFRVASALDHPHLVRALAFGVEKGFPYLVMEFVDGITLADRIEREERLAEAEAVRLVTQVAGALDLAHRRGLVHRDVKPENVLLTGGGEAKLADLGLAKEVEGGGNLTRTGTGLGTPNFMPPEQFRDAKGADSRSDVYALAATLYMAVTGVLPFAGGGPVDIWKRKLDDDLAPPRRLAPALSERIDWAIRRAMSADPALRPASCLEFIEDLTGHRVRDAGGGVLATEAPRELWFLVYADAGGAVQTAKGSVDAVRRLLKGGLLRRARGVRVGLSEAGPFESLLAHPEFRDLVIGPGALSVGTAGRRAQDTPVPGQAPGRRTARSTRAIPSPLMAAEAAVAGEAATGAWDGAGAVRWNWMVVVALAAAAFLLGLSILSLTPTP